jgi:glycosyltransferase involved in cell wall biosynthesis
MRVSGFNVKLVVADGKGNENVNGVSITDIGKPSSRLSRMLWYPFKLKKHIQKEHIIHIHDPELLPFVFILSLVGYQVIYDVHEDLPRQILSKPWIPSMLRVIFSKIAEIFENFFSKRLSGIICATEEIYKRFSSLGVAVTKVQNTPILSEFGNLNLDQRKGNTICYVGGISRTRGILQLVQALELAPEVKLILAGEFQDQGLRKEVESLAGWKQVEYKGHVGRTEIAAILNSSDIGVVTLLPIVNYMESMPVKMFEYMAASLPVLASNFPLWITIIEDNKVGVCVDPTSPSAIANSIKSMLFDKKELTTMSSKGCLLAESHYNWKNDARALNDFYRLNFYLEKDTT